MHFFKSAPNAELLDSLRRDDRYRKLGYLGKGRLADLASYFDQRLGRIVALKRLRPDYAKHPEHLRSFLNETKLVAYLDHPGVVSIYDVFLLGDNEPCYTMKVIKGNDLRWEYSHKSRGQLLSIFTKLCETLAYVHDKGVAHLDLTPENVMIGQYGEVMITGWGNARLYDERPYQEYLKLVRDAPSPPVEDDSAPCEATPSYMSPEQTAGQREGLDALSDVFSMGVILFEMMTGQLPFRGETVEALHNQIRGYQQPLLHQLNPEVPWMLSQIGGKMLAKDPFQRYHSFHEVLIDLDKLQTSGQAFRTPMCKAGTLIVREGERGDFAFTVLRGEVAVSRMVDGQQKELARLGPGEVVGELAIFTNEPRTATVTATRDNTVIRIMDRASVEQELQKLSPWVENMITGLSKRFIDLNQRLVGGEGS